MVKDGMTEMTDSEIIALLSDYNFKEKEMSKIIRNLKTRDFESVLKYIEDIQSDGGVAISEEEREKALKEAHERNIEMKKDAEAQTRYKEQLVEKIRANREEHNRRYEREDNTMKAAPVEKTVRVEGYIRVRAVLAGKEDIVLGFDEDATIEDLYQRMREKVGRDNISIMRFGHSESIPCSQNTILKEFKARSIMIDVE